MPNLDNLIDDLQAFGFSPIEAKVYLALVSQNTPMTGYQVAKAANIPRPNVYPALKRLIQRGACLENPDQDVIRYVAVPFQTLGHRNRLGLGLALMHGRYR
ncbi:TrmB family transcriptional regulator [Sulfobacillus thermotolerans]|uniref:TrmB family transcriptional regulator n=1 Tax=Sulfobacillus thermotolerans TaxID=338644 RepID=UPI00336809B8